MILGACIYGTIETRCAQSQADGVKPDQKSTELKRELSSNMGEPGVTLPYLSVTATTPRLALAEE